MRIPDRVLRRSRPIAAAIARHWVLWASLAALLVVASTFTDFGVTWDEGVQARYGELVLEYFRSGGVDRRHSEYLDLRFYGPALESALALLYRPWPELRFDIRHLALGFLAVGLIPALAAFAKRFGRRAIGPFAVLALVATPRLVGHAPNNSKDIPFALALCVFMATLTPLLVAKRRHWRAAFATGAAAGATLAIRPGGLPLLLGLFGGALLLAHHVAPFPSAGSARRDMGLRLGGVALLSWIGMVALWPWAHENPIGHPIEAILQATNFAHVYPVLFAGSTFDSDSLPRLYLPVYLLITTPLPLLALALFGAVMEARRARKDEDPVRRFSFGLTLIWLGLPVLGVVVLRPNLYDGLRHFLFVLPAICILAGLGAWHLGTRLAATSFGRLSWAGVTLLLMLPLISIARLHPYETSSFNALVGGLRGAEGRFELDYWGTSLREATAYVNQQRPTQNDDARTRPLRLLLGTTSPYPKTAVEYAAAPGIQVVTLGDLSPRTEAAPQIDYYVAPVRYGMDRYFADKPIVYRVTREGVSLAIVRDMGGVVVRAWPASTGNAAPINASGLERERALGAVVRSQAGAVLQPGADID